MLKNKRIFSLVISKLIVEELGKGGGGGGGILTVLGAIYDLYQS